MFQIVINYIIGIFLTFYSVFMFQLLGECIVKKEHTYSYSFIIGYIVYSFFVAVVGIPIQIFKLSWYIFFAWMVFLLIVINIIIFINVKHNNVELTKSLFLEYLKQNWVLYVGSILILIFSLSHISTIWSNNLTDDSFYINKMATLPYIRSPFSTSPETGFLSKGSFTSYDLNTFELEGSFYLFITKMVPTLYCRVFLAILNYFIMLNSIHAFMYKMLIGFGKSKLDNILSHIVVCVFVFFLIFFNTKISSEASWTIITASYFGSSLVRISSIFIILLPLIDIKRLSTKEVIITAMSCFVMISKSSVALPLIIMLAIGFLILYLFYNENKVSKILSFALIIFVILLGIILPNKIDINNLITENVVSNSFNLFLIALCGIIYFIGKNNKVLLKVLIIFIILNILMITPQINDIFENFSVYSFVAERSRYTIYLSILIISLVYSLVYFLNRINYRKVLIGISVLTLFSETLVFITKYQNANLISSLKVYARNPYIVPQSTLDLGRELEKIYKATNKKLIVMMQPGLQLNGYTHFTGAIIRSFAPNVQSVIAGIRVSTEITGDDNDFIGFSIDDYNTFNNFYSNPSYGTLMELQELNMKYPFNCIIGQNFTIEQSEMLTQIGYENVSNVKNTFITYNIYIKVE